MAQSVTSRLVRIRASLTWEIDHGICRTWAQSIDGAAADMGGDGVVTMNPMLCKQLPLATNVVATREPGANAGLTLHSRELFRQGSVVQIRHQGQTYQLRLTRQDKLILTK